jgi:thymidylate synthase (FAD)
LTAPSVRLLSYTPEPEAVVARAGRTCYDSHHLSSPDADARLIRALIRRGHESVLEHASLTFEIVCSRVVSHELVRHRLTSVSQRSQRYVREDELRYFTPPEVADPAAQREYDAAMIAAWSYYGMLLKRGVSKQLARYVLPNACLTTMVVTANLREWRHIIKLRAAPDCQPEMQEIARGILAVVREAAPWAVEDVA